MKALYHIDKGVFNTIEALNFFDPFEILWAEIKNKHFVWFLVQLRTRKFAFEITDL